MSFSKRIGKVPATKEIQLESIDEDLQNGLWNVIKVYILDRISKRKGYGTEGDFREFSKSLYHHFYKLPIDTIPDYDVEIEHFIRDKYFKGEWFEKYDLVEILTNFDYQELDINEYMIGINRVLEREFSGYRFIDGVLAPISNEIEIAETNKTLEVTGRYTALSGANIHISKALEKLSDRKNPDYRNSIKESISAVEATCRILTGKSTLGKALNALAEKGINLDDQVKSGVIKLYAFTNSKESGIRHAIIEDHKNPDFTDAKYMLVTCSSFINFLVGKCIDQGISID